MSHLDSEEVFFSATEQTPQEDVMVTEQECLGKLSLV